MQQNQYELYFGAMKIGVIDQIDSDFPNLWGKITYDPALSEPRSEAGARLLRFVALNQESIRLAELEKEQESEREKAVNDELAADFNDLIESEDWRLIDAHGQAHPILCPILRDSGEIVWRWGAIEARPEASEG
jgi:hypothetical protein